MQNAYTINAVVTEMTEQNVCGLYVGCKICGLQKHSQLFVIVVHVPHPAEQLQCTADDV